MSQYQGSTVFAPPDDPRYGEPSPQRKRTNVVGVIGFVLSLLGFIGCCIPFVGGIGTVGLVVSLIGLYRSPRGFAIAGVVLGLLATLALVVWIGIVSVFGSLAGSIGGWQNFLWTMAIASEADQHRQRTGEFPPDLAQLSNLPPQARTDSWGTPFVYERSGDGQRYSLSSAGEDRISGTGDDLDLGEKLQQSGFTFPGQPVPRSTLSLPPASSNPPSILPVPPASKTTPGDAYAPTPEPKKDGGPV